MPSLPLESRTPWATRTARKGRRPYFARRVHAMDVSTRTSPSANGSALCHEPDRLLSSEDVAGLLQVSHRTLWRLVKAGRFPQPVRLNRKFVRWRRSDYEAWMER